MQAFNRLLATRSTKQLIPTLYRSSVRVFQQPHLSIFHRVRVFQQPHLSIFHRVREFSSSASKMSNPSGPIIDSTTNFPKNDTTTPGEQFEPRQTSTSEDYHPDPSKSISLSPNRQALIDDIIALYSCQPTVERVKRYTPDCVYDDQFVYANDRYKMAGQWFGLPKLFKESKNLSYEIIKNDRDLIQFKNEQSWTFRLIPKTVVINGLVSLSLDPGTTGDDAEFVRVKYHKDQANEKDYSHEGLGFHFKKWQADNVPKYMDSEEVEAFAADKNAAKEDIKTYGDGFNDAPTKDF